MYMYVCIGTPKGGAPFQSLQFTLQMKRKKNFQIKRM